MESNLSSLKEGSIFYLNVRDHVAKMQLSAVLNSPVWDYIMSNTNWENEVYPLIISVQEAHWKVLYNGNIFRLAWQAPRTFPAGIKSLSEVL